MEITHDPSTWPSGNKTWTLAHAIAQTEGANLEGKVPDALNNPGDISDYGKEYVSEYHSGSYVTHFPDKASGWAALYEKLENCRLRRSHVYTPDMTFVEFGQLWSGNALAWSKDVTSILGVELNSTLKSYWES